MSYETKRPPNHELNLSRIQSLDFTFQETRDWVFEKFSLKINPVIVFEGYKENEVHRYDLRIQSDSWEGFGGKYSTKKPYTEAASSENSDPNFDCVFTLSDFKKALEENKNRMILYFISLFTSSSSSLYIQLQLFHFYSVSEFSSNLFLLLHFILLAFPLLNFDLHYYLQARRRRFNHRAIHLLHLIRLH